jgi:imidazolonepropionase-like amidohydrolase
VGADVKPPSDAETISGEGLTVYPGFVDALSTTGFTLPEAQPIQDAPADTTAFAPPFMREANRKGVRPEMSVADYLSLDEARLMALRQSGFTTQLLVPTGGMINGFGVVINLSGRPKREAVVSDAVVQGFGFQSGGFGAYPGSLMGVFAHLRQTLLDAKRQEVWAATFLKNGGARPPADSVLNALHSVFQRNVPALFTANSENEISRALKLGKEFGLRPIVGGGEYAFRRVADLKSAEVPVFLSLNFGKEPQPPGNEDDTPARVLEERKRLWRERAGNAAALEKGGVLFAFTTQGLRSPSEIWEAVRQAMKAGLSRAAALRALSLHAAQILGFSRQLGTVEAGKIAALTILTGDFADSKTQVKLLFIDNQKFEPDKEKPTVPARRPMRPRNEMDDEDPHFAEGEGK